MKKKKLIICEKPAVAFEISKYLNLNEKKDGFYSGEDYVVTWCVGHLCTLKDPKDYDESWEKWTFESLPIIPKKYENKVIFQTKKQYQVVKKLLNSKEFEFVINGCDAGREGELIFQNIYSLSGSTLNIFRMWTSAAITKDSILRELKNLKPMSQFQGLANAARARACADWAVGINGTRALTLGANIYKELVSVGRVQTPTLTFLVSREIEIKNFKSKKFYQIKADLNKDGLKFTAIHEYFDKDINSFETKFNDIEVAKKVVSEILNCKRANVTAVTESEKKVKAPLLFSLTELQKEANKFYSFSAQKTLEIAQSLYEKHKLISYPRTDSSCLPDDMLNLVENLFLFVGEYFNSLANCAETILNDAKFKTNKRVFDNSRVSDHHALIPTGIKNTNELSKDEMTIFELICKRFIAAFLDDYKELNKKVQFNINSLNFRINGKSTLYTGWKEAYSFKDQNKEEEEQSIPDLKKGDLVSVQKVFLDEGVTKPPQRYTEATLLAAMESPSKFLDKEQAEEKEILKDKGLGTPATRANIIDSMMERKYAERKGKSLVPTKKAIALIQNLKPESLKSPLMTAQWEQKLSAIERNEYSVKNFALELNHFVTEIIENSIECGKRIKYDFSR